MSKGMLYRMLTCPICGKVYKQTNWMFRREPGYKGLGIAKTDTHVLACRKKQEAK